MQPKLTPYYNSRRNLTSNFFGTGSNHTTAIIIIVVCAAAGMLILFCLFRFFRHSWARGSAPLPPMQPIASYREQRLMEFEEQSIRFTTYPQPPSLSPPLKSSPAASDSSSILVTEETFPSRKSSLYTAEKGNVQDEEEVLQIPDAVLNHSNSSLCSLPSTPPSASVVLSSPSQATLPHSYPHRAASAVSKTSIGSVRSSGRIGVPHGPHSQVNIILPSPLAPALYPYMSGPEAGRLGIDGPQMSVRSSLVDMWAPPLHRSVSSDHIGKLSSFSAWIFELIAMIRTKSAYSSWYTLAQSITFSRSTEDILLPYFAIVIWFLFV